MNKCKYFEQQDIFGGGTLLYSSCFCWHNGTPQEINQQTCAECQQAQPKTLDSTPKPFDTVKSICKYCDCDYNQEIICYNKRYHSSYGETVQIIPTNFCPVCGRKLKEQINDTTNSNLY